MQIQSDLPELIKIKTSVSGELYKNNSVIISERIKSEKNMFFKVKIDLSTMIGQGSFGSIHPCVLTIMKGSEIVNEVDDLVIKVLRNKECIDDNKDLYREIIIHCLVYNSVNDLTPKIYPYTMNIDAKVGIDLRSGIMVKCYNGLLQENISSGSINLYRNRLCNSSSNKTPDEIVDDYFKMINSIKDTLLDLYKNYNFKHNDLHSGNILFSGLDPKIIDYGESTINHRFSNMKLVSEVNPKSIESFYGLYHQEYEKMHYNYPLSDLHLFIFSSYNVFTEKKNIGPIIDISDVLISRLESIYSLTKLGVRESDITFDGIVVKLKDEFRQIYKDARRIIKYLIPKILDGTKACWDELFGKWSIFDFRIMSFLYAIYLSDKVNYNMYTNIRIPSSTSKKSTSMFSKIKSALGMKSISVDNKTIDYGLADRRKFDSDSD